MSDRTHAWTLLNEYTKNPNLLKHALAVEAAMRWYAARGGEDVDKWGVVGLLHDFDYERWPTANDHPLQGALILAAAGYPEDMIYAIKSHVPSVGVARLSALDQTLFAVDELCGFITAVALVRPSRSLHDLGSDSVRKKMKDKRFAAGVSREDIVVGAAELGLELDTHISNVIAAMRGIAADLGLAGAAAIAG